MVSYYLQYDDGRGWANKGRWVGPGEVTDLVDEAKYHRGRWPNDDLRIRAKDDVADIIVYHWLPNSAVTIPEA